jgi:hypothetical protein
MDELAIEYLEFQPVDMIYRLIDPGHFGERLLYHAKATMDQIRSWRICPEIYRNKWNSLYEYADLMWQHDQVQDDASESDDEGFPEDDDFRDINGVIRDRDISWYPGQSLFNFDKYSLNVGSVVNWTDRWWGRFPLQANTSSNGENLWGEWILLL